MNIYFVNRYSKLKGPFDIIDSNRQHLIKVGDICLRDTIEGVVFYVVYNSTNLWSACKLVGVGKNETLPDIGNTLLFSFDGLSRRKGDVALIKLLTLCFREKVIDDFFRNAVDILEYKKDFWEGSLFPQFFSSSQELVDRDKQKKLDVSTEANHYPSIFAQYLSKELQELFIASLNDGNELKEAYQILREKHPESFRKALMQFLTENPNGTIFDKPADSFVPIVKEVETPKTTFHNNRQLRITLGFDDEPLKVNERTEQYLLELRCQKLLSAEEEVDFAQKIRKGDIDARNILVRANMRFVASFAKQYLHKGLEFEDLLHDGFLGLIKAAERYDETRGFKFISYATWWIRRYLTDAIVKYSSLIQFPLNVQILHRRIWNFKIKYEHKKGFFPPITEIEVDDEENLERISFLDSLPNNLKNTCIPCEDLDVFEDNHNDIFDYENNEYNNNYVKSLLARLSKRERNILLKAFGIGVREETLENIGEYYGLSRERVRQIKEKAIRKLQDMTFVTSAEGQLSENQSRLEENSTGQVVTTKNIEETQTLKEVKEVFSQFRYNTVQLTEAKMKKPAESDKVVCPSEKTNEASRNVVNLKTCNYIVENINGKCNIYDHNKKQVYSSTGSVKEINQSYYRVSLTFSFFSIVLIKKNLEGELFNADIVLLANQQTKLHHMLNRKDFIEKIEDIKRDGRRIVKVDGCWYDEHGNEVSEKTSSNSNIIEHHEVAKEYFEENSTRKPEIPNKVDELDVEHVFVDTFDALPYKDVEVEIEQSNEDKSAEGGETLPIWTYATNVRFSKRSKRFLNCKCRVGLSKTGYYLIINHRFIKLGDYPDGYKNNVGNIWIKRPIDDKGYRMIHENEKGSHLIGYAIEKGEIVVFISPDNEIYSVSFDGRIISSVKNKKFFLLKDIDIDKLWHAFDKKATSYKYFWFLSILKIYYEIRTESIFFKDILIEMVSIAWRYVFVEECQFPSQDQLPIYLRAIQAKTYLTRSVKEKKVEETVRKSYNERKWNTLLMPLLNNVPYRFLSPWIPFTNNEEVTAKSKEKESRCPYSLANDHVTINPLWSNYLVENYDKISFFIEKELRLYLKCK